MQNAAGDGAAIRSDDRNNIVNAVVTDLVSLISRIQSSARLIESAITHEASSGGHESVDIVVLDDITPCYLKAQAVLNSCSSGLGAALHFLIEANSNQPDRDHFRPADSIIRA